MPLVEAVRAHILRLHADDATALAIESRRYLRDRQAQQGFDRKFCLPTFLPDLPTIQPNVSAIITPKPSR
jgi:hypothetical protein